MTFWTIAQNDLKLNIKDKMFVFWLLVFPLLFAFLFGLAFPGSSGEAVKVSLGVLDMDQSSLSRGLIEELKGEKYEVQEVSAGAGGAGIGERGAVVPAETGKAEEALGEEAETEAEIAAKTGEALDEVGSAGAAKAAQAVQMDMDKLPRTLIIPENFARDILNGKKVELVLRKKEESNREASQAAYSTVLKAVIKILAKIVLIAPADKNELAQKLQSFELERLITLKTEMVGKLRFIPGGYSRMIPASAVMFILFSVFMYGGITLLEERRGGMLERVYLSPASFSSIIGGKWLSRLLLGMLQVVLLFLAGKVLFKTHLGSSVSSWLGLFFVALFFCGAVAGLSILLGCLMRKEEVLIVFNILLANVMAALGGCWVPLELFPPGLKVASFVFPTGWTMDAFNKLIFYGYNLQSVFPNITVLFLYTLVFFALAARFLKLRRV